MERARVDVVHREGEVVGQLSLVAQHGLNRVGRLDVVGDEPRRLRLREGLKLVYRRHAGDAGERELREVQDRRGGDEELLLVDAVKAVGLQSQFFADAVVEDAEAAADHRLRLSPPAAPVTHANESRGAKFRLRLTFVCAS